MRSFFLSSPPPLPLPPRTLRKERRKEKEEERRSVEIHCCYLKLDLCLRKLMVVPVFPDKTKREKQTKMERDKPENQKRKPNYFCTFRLKWDLKFFSFN